MDPPLLKILNNPLCQRSLSARDIYNTNNTGWFIICRSHLLGLLSILLQRERMEHPRRLQPQFESCYKLSPTRDDLFRLLNVLMLYISHPQELSRRLPTGFYVMDIFDHQLDDMVTLTSAEDGKFYVFTCLKTYANGMHSCKTVDGSWEKQRLIYKERDRSVQLATFHTILKQRSKWSMELYSFHGQKLALCVIYNTTAKRKPGSLVGNDMLPRKRPRQEQPSQQENRHSLVASPVPTEHDSVEHVPTMCLPSTYLLHQDYIERIIQSYGIGMTGLLNDIIQPGHLHDIVRETAGVVEPTSEICPSNLGTHVAECSESIQQSSTFNLSSLDTFGIDDILDFDIPISTQTSPLGVDTDAQHIEEGMNMIQTIPPCDTRIGAGTLIEGWHTHPESLLGFPFQGFGRTAF